jgi:EpsI family protein
MVRRLAILSMCFLATAVVALRGGQPERVLLHEPLAQLPYEIGTWAGQDAARFTIAEESILGADEYLNRTYLTPGAPPLGLYVGYYQSQRQGDTMHSPLNCLPGAGWEPVSTGRTTIAIPGQDVPLTVNRFVIQKGLDRQVVLYWYQSHGRVIASEYWSKAYLIYDAVRLNRSDAAMVRVITPIVASHGGEQAATQRGIEFVQNLFPQLTRFFPS